MTHCSDTYNYRTAGNDAEIHVTRKSDLYVWGWSEYRWSVSIRRDGEPYFVDIKKGLKTRPSKKRLEGYIGETLVLVEVHHS